MTKEEYIGDYIQKRMKNNKLPYGIEYLGMIDVLIGKAEKAWDKLNKHVVIVSKNSCSKLNKTVNVIDHCGKWAPPISMNSKISYFCGHEQCGNCFWFKRN